MAEETLRGLNAIEKDIDTAIQDYNEAMLASKIDKATKANASLEKLEAEYGKAKAANVYAGLKASKTPMLDAIRRYSYTAIGHKDETDKDGKFVVRTKKDKERQIDLLKFEQVAKESYAVNDKWSFIAQRFNQLLCMRTAQELGLSVKVCDSYFVSEKAKEIALGKTPTSNSAILKELQTVINAIIGDAYKATSHDVSYLLLTYSKKGKNALSVACSNHTTMRLLIADILHRIVTAKGYSIEFKVEKQKVEKPATVTETQAAA